MTEQSTTKAPALETVTVKPGKTHIHKRVLYSGDAEDKARRTFQCRPDQAKRLKAAGVVQ